MNTLRRSLGRVTWVTHLLIGLVKSQAFCFKCSQLGEMQGLIPTSRWFLLLGIGCFGMLTNAADNVITTVAGIDSPVSIVKLDALNKAKADTQFSISLRENLGNSFLPALGQNFTGGIAVHGQPHQSQAVLSLSDTVEIAGDFTVDPADVGKVADIFIYAAVHLPGDANNTYYYMVGEGYSVSPWDQNSYNLVPFMPNVTLEASHHVPMWNGTLPVVGTLNVFFGYRLPNGNLISNNQSIDITIVPIAVEPIVITAPEEFPVEPTVITAPEEFPVEPTVITAPEEFPVEPTVITAPEYFAPDYSSDPKEKISNSLSPYCLIAGSYPRGSPVVMGTCDYQNSDWYKEGDKIHNRWTPYCLAIQEDSQELYSPVIMGDCDSITSNWGLDNNKYYNQAGNCLFLSLEGEGMTQTEKVVMGPCDYTNSEWSYGVIPSSIGVDPVPVGPLKGEGLFLTGDEDLRWPIGSTLKVAMKFDNASRSSRPWPCTEDDTKVKGQSNWQPCFDKVKAEIERFAKEWSLYGNIYFDFQTASWEQADIRIGFDEPTNSYSRVGAAGCKSVEPPAKNMNLGFGMLSSETEYSRIVIHEFGHALGLYHEHTRPDQPYTWTKHTVRRDNQEVEEEVAITDLMTWNDWTKDKAFSNFLELNKGRHLFSTEYDPDSIMIYSIPATWVSQTDLDDHESCPDGLAPGMWLVPFYTNYCVAPKTKLSEMDKLGIAQFYPFQTATSGNGTPWGEWSGTVYCPSGSWATGYEMRVESNQGKGDDTALNAIALDCMDRNGNDYRIVPHGGSWGDWYPRTDCPPGEFLTQFQLKVESPQGNGDDTAANSVAFMCSGGQRIEAAGGGPWGNWGAWQGGNFSQSAICGVRAKFEEWKEEQDDTGLNDLEFIWCSF